MYTQEFVNLVMGDRNMYPIPFDKNGGDASIDTEAKQLLDHGYVVSNLLDLKTLTAEQMAAFYTSFKPEFKEGYILRKGFANRKKFREYSEEEWRVIFAQYSLTYGWSGQYQDAFGMAAADVIDAYNDDEIAVVDQIMTGAKVIRIGFRSDTVNLIKEILESKVVLRTHQKKTLDACPIDVLAEAYRKSNITIRETMIQAIVLLKDSNEVVEKVFNTPTDVLRFILAKFAHKPFEGQITKPDLADRKVRIPTSYRKWLMMELDNMGSPKRICEDMFKYDAYWKLMHRYLRYGKAATARKRFVRYHEAIDLLFDGDRSWTFNGRYSAAIESGDYAQALAVAKERPGFLFRNMLNFLRYPAGTKIAQAAGAKRVSLDPMDKGNTKVVQTDGLTFFESQDFIKLVAKSNAKLAFQLMEQLKGPSIFSPQTTRTVQGITKRYSTPIPGVKKALAKKVRKAVEAGIHQMLAERNKNVGMVYLDKSLKDTSLQYSGRNSTETNYSGTFLTPGSKIDIPDERILRMGVLWRGPRSTDIDHNCGVYEGNTRIFDVYFGQPTYNDLVNSSGDITSCSESSFSVEFIDIDLEKVRKTNITSLVTSMISYSGNPISDCETYLFVKGLSRSDRKIKGRSIKMDLMDTDYAIRIDPDKQENSTGYIGFNTTILDNKIQVCAYTDPKDAGNRYSTIRNRDFSPEFLEGLFGNQTSLYKTLKMAFHPDQLTTDPKFADVIIGEGGLNPQTDLEAINKFIL